MELIFRTPQLHQLDFKWDFLIERLFNALKIIYIHNNDKSFRILSIDVDKIIRREDNPSWKVRLICDQIAGMTDGFAIRTYAGFSIPILVQLWICYKALILSNIQRHF